MRIQIVFPFIALLLLSGCSTVGEVYDWAFDDDEDDVKAVITNENKSQFEYVTVNIKDKIAVKVADPLGPRATGVGCAMWKSSTGESGRCARFGSNARFRGEDARACWAVVPLRAAVARRDERKSSSKKFFSERIRRRATVGRNGSRSRSRYRDHVSF